MKTEYLLALRTLKFLAAEALVKNLGVWLDKREGGIGGGGGGGGGGGVRNTKIL